MQEKKVHDLKKQMVNIKNQLSSISLSNVDTSTLDMKELLGESQSQAQSNVSSPTITSMMISTTISLDAIIADVSRSRSASRSKIKTKSISQTKNSQNLKFLRKKSKKGGKLIAKSKFPRKIGNSTTSSTNNSSANTTANNSDNENKDNRDSNESTESKDSNNSNNNNGNDDEKKVKMGQRWKVQKHGILHVPLEIEQSLLMRLIFVIVRCVTSHQLRHIFIMILKQKNQ